MRRVALVPAALLAAAAIATPSAAFAAAPDFRDRIDESFTDPDFCGTGAAVEVHDRVVAQGYDDGTVFRVTVNQTTTFTYGGRSLIAQGAGHVLAESQDGAFDEPHTEVIRESGLRAKVLIPGEGVVTIDHGLIVYSITWVANPDPATAEEEPLVVSDVQVIKDAGGHPGFYDNTFCAAATDFFGL